MERQHKLIGLLNARREVFVTDAARELGASERTVYRDLAVLERIGVPIYQEHEGKRSRWKVVDQYQHRLSLTLSWAEVLALSAGRGLLAGLRGTFFHGAAGTALDKIRASVPKELSARAAALLRHVTSGDGASRDHASASDGVERVVVAIERRESMRFEYRKPSRRGYEPRVVDPYHLHVQGDGLYLIGWCHDRRAMRIFAVSRMRELAATGQRFVRSAAFDPESFVHGPSGAWSGKPQRVRLRFSATAAATLRERRFHQSQVSQLRRDGSLDVTLQVPVSPALVSFVVSFGPRVKVVGPEELGRKVVEEHRAALEGLETVSRRTAARRRKSRDP